MLLFLIYVANAKSPARNYIFFFMSFNKMVQWKVGNNCVICDTGKEVEFGDKYR